MIRPDLEIVNGHVTATSVDIARVFERSHKNVLRDIENVLPHVSEEFSRLNFEPRDYIDSRGKTQPCYQITRNGFAMIALAFTGAKGIRFREAYVTRFDQMEAYLRRRLYKRSVENLVEVADVVRDALGGARATMTLSLAYNLLVARGLHIPLISREGLIKLIKTGEIEGYKSRSRWHVYQDSFAAFIERRKLV